MPERWMTIISPTHVVGLNLSRGRRVQVHHPSIIHKCMAEIGHYHSRKRVLGTTKERRRKTQAAGTGLPQSPYPHVARKVKNGQKWPKNVQKEAPENGVLGVFKVP
jgi:hypothetical protein